jgi:hypothetical protein
MRARFVLVPAVAAVTVTLTVGPAAPAVAPIGSQVAGRHHVDRVDRVARIPVQPMHSMCGGEVV